MFWEELLTLVERLRILYLFTQEFVYSQEKHGIFGEPSTKLIDCKKHLASFIPSFGGSVSYHNTLENTTMLPDFELCKLVFDANNYNVIQKSQDFAVLNTMIINTVLGSAF